jgi:SulP family sulfate permease
MAVWQSGLQSQVAMVTTFVATLVLPVAAAVGIGVALSLLLSINREAQDVRIVSLTETADGDLVEGPVPRHLESHSVTVLNTYGSLFYAGARTFQNALPAVGDAEEAVVVIRLRGRTVIGATAFAVLSSYANELAAGGGRLYLSGVAPELVAQFERAGRIESGGPIRVVEATPTLGESTRRAIDEAESFLLHGAEPIPGSEAPQPLATRVYKGVSRLWTRG